MHKISALLIFFTSFSFHISAQILPKPDSKLNYRMIGFKSDAVKKAKGYTLEIAKGIHTSEPSFNQHIIASVNCDSNSVVAEVPEWNTSYTWRMTGGGKNAKNKKSVFYHFSTGTTHNIDSTITRLRVTQFTDEYKDHYVFMDGTRAMYDMNGRAVWYLPAKDNLYKENVPVRDMKLSPYGTITFIIGDAVYETDYNGTLLWKGPPNESGAANNSEHFHHELTRLSNGHYMALGTEFEETEIVSFRDTARKDKTSRTNMAGVPNKPGNKMALGTVIEYDDTGKLVWKWRSSDHFSKSDIFERKTIKNKSETAPHDNAFFYDEKQSVIYISYKNISRILKISYPEGKVLNSYGETFEAGKEAKGNGLYCGQHCCRVSKSGLLYVYDNNTCGKYPVPRIVMMEERGGKLKEAWTYNCVADDTVVTKRKPGSTLKYDFSSGGSVSELADSSLFVCMSGYITDSAFTSSSPSDSKVFIVGKDKKIRWCAIPEKWNPGTKRWRRIAQYRASIAGDKKELANLIWHTKNE